MSQPCATWPATDDDRFAGPFTARTASPVLVVGNLYDPATPYSGAQTVAAQLPRARLLTLAGWGHTSLAKSSCVARLRGPLPHRQAAPADRGRSAHPISGPSHRGGQPPAATAAASAAAVSALLPPPRRSRRDGHRPQRPGTRHRPDEAWRRRVLRTGRVDDEVSAEPGPGSPAPGARPPAGQPEAVRERWRRARSRRGTAPRPGRDPRRGRGLGAAGSGGAGFPTGRKWRTVAANRSSTIPTTVVVNGAEGEPGSFKDRAILRANPYRVLEGALIAAGALGADRIVVAVKRSFRAEVERLAAAIDAIRAAGWSEGVDLLVVEGPAEYLYGEETALLEVIDGREPFPRVAPPYRHGVDEVGPDDASAAQLTMAAPDGADAAPPTLVNNVETMANVARVLPRAPTGSERSARPSRRARSSARCRDARAATASPRSRWARRCARSSTSSGAVRSVVARSSR